MNWIRKYKNHVLASLILVIFAWQLYQQYHDSSLHKGAAAEYQNDLLVTLYQERRSDQFLTVQGKVYRVLRDDTKGSQHQRFLIYVNNISVLVAHNIDLAPRVPLQVGDIVALHGEYEYTKKGGVLHWTHHNPRPHGTKYGWIDHNGTRYQ